MAYQQILSPNCRASWILQLDLLQKPGNMSILTPVMINLHWLPIQYRIQFKLLLLIYKSLHGLAPSHLTDKLSLRPNKGLRSDNQLLLNVPVSTLRLKFYGDRAFSVARPTLWNALPKNIRLCAILAAFNTSLKTYLFKKAYKVWPCVPYWYILLHICFYYLHWFFTFITSLYQLCQSLAMIECYISILYHNCITLIYFIALHVLFVFYVQRWRTLWFGAIKINNYYY